MYLNIIDLRVSSLVLIPNYGLEINKLSCCQNI